MKEAFTNGPRLRRGTAASLAAYAALGLLVLGGSAMPAIAALGVSVSAPQPLNSNAVSDAAVDERPALATDGSGLWVAVWGARGVAGDPNGTDTDLLFARSTDDGQTWSTPAPLNTTAAADSGSDSGPSIAVDAAGVWLVCWVSTEAFDGSLNIGTDTDILCARSTDGGQTWSTPTPVNPAASDGDAIDAGVSVASDGRGGWRVVWFSTNSLGGTIGTDEDILTASSADSGATWSAAALVNTSGATDNGLDRDARLATDGQGRWIVVWSSTDTLGGTIGADRDILFARSGDNGASWSATAAIHNNAASDTAADREPDIATDRNGTWLVVWSSPENINNTGTDKDIYFVRSTNVGQTWTAPAPVNLSAQFDSGSDSFPTLAAGKAGEFACVWTAENAFGGSFGNDFDLLIACTSDSGGSWTQPIAFNTTAGSDTATDLGVRLFSDRAGNWIGAWERIDGLTPTFGIDADIFFARFATPDCNGNQIVDADDIASTRSADCNANGIPDDCEIDSDGDGVIDACENGNSSGNGNSNTNTNVNRNSNSSNTNGGSNANSNSGDNSNDNAPDNQNGNASGNANGNTNTNGNTGGGNSSNNNGGGGFTGPGGGNAPPVGVAGCGGCGAAGVPFVPLTMLGIACLKHRARRRC